MTAERAPAWSFCERRGISESRETVGAPPHLDEMLQSVEARDVAVVLDARVRAVESLDCREDGRIGGEDGERLQRKLDEERCSAGHAAVNKREAVSLTARG